MGVTSEVFFKEVIRIALVLAVSLGLALVANAVHPMGLPLRLGEVKRPGIPAWVGARMRQTDPPGAWKKVAAGQGILVDVRDEEEFRTERARGAINLPYHDFDAVYPSFSETVAEDDPLFIYCYGTSCGLSPRVAKRLMELGYTNLTVVKQGFDAWKKAGLPVEKGGGDAENSQQTTRHQNKRAGGKRL